ncbi:MAG: hypothetical protein ACM359_24240 [Bacillota bacterium]
MNHSIELFLQGPCGSDPDYLEHLIHRYFGLDRNHLMSTHRGVCISPHVLPPPQRAKALRPFCLLLGILLSAECDDRLKPSDVGAEIILWQGSDTKPCVSYYHWVFALRALLQLADREADHQPHIGRMLFRDTVGLVAEVMKKGGAQ